MQRQDLLPGVSADGYEPKVVCRTRPVITRARRIALLTDVAQLLLVGTVDWLFLLWPSAHVPLAGRGESLVIVLAFNALVAAHVLLARKLPEWSARRIASTWCPAERKRFAAPPPSLGRQ